MAKRYYWLKLPDGFFRQKAIKKLRKIAGGDTYTIIYLKMLLVAMKQDGRLYFEGVEATFYDEFKTVSGRREITTSIPPLHPRCKCAVKYVRVKNENIQ